VRTLLASIGDTAVDAGAVNEARMLRHRYRDLLRLLDDLGWRFEDAGAEFAITMDPDALMRAAVKTTTVRFDAETWADIERESEALGVAHAEFIRGAVHRRLGRLADADRLAAVEHELGTVADRLSRVARIVARLSRRCGGSDVRTSSVVSDQVQ
jgi:hypothetical protein